MTFSIKNLRIGVFAALLLATPLGAALAEGDPAESAADAPAAKAEAPAEKPAKAAANDHGVADSVGDGSRVSVKDGDFTLVPPRGWEVYTKMPGLTVLMQVPFATDVKYQRTIQVAAFAEPRYIDEVTAKEMEEVITRKFSAATSSIEGYRIRNHLPVKMADGRDGWLFYTEFTLNGVSMMQAHILISSKLRHYLMTYTDIAQHFESDAANQFLTEAWDSMISAQLGSSTPTRYQTAQLMVAVVVVLLILVVGAAFFRRWRSGQEYREYGAGADFEGAAADRMEDDEMPRRDARQRQPEGRRRAGPPESGEPVRGKASNRVAPVQPAPAARTPRPARQTSGPAEGLPQLPEGQEEPTAPPPRSSRPAPRQAPAHTQPPRSEIGKAGSAKDKGAEQPVTEQPTSQQPENEEDDPFAFEDDVAS